MYHPPRGGVRGGADQFNWEDVKSDKHRENYLGHSVKAPVGRWQKGKDLLWYSKDRSSDKNGTRKSDSSEILAIKKAEEEAMLAALGHKIVQKETQPLTKEEMAEVLKRNTTERDALNVERVEGVGVMSARAAMLVNSSSQKRSKTEGISFETSSSARKNISTLSDNEKEKSSERKVLSKKSSKKHKKEKKHKKKKKREQYSSESSSTDDENRKAMFHRKKDREKHFGEGVRSKHSEYSSEGHKGHSQKNHKKPPSVKGERFTEHEKRKRKSRHVSSSDSESSSEAHDFIPPRARHSKRKRHDSSSSN